jgi:hypothetical protein
MAYIRRGPGPRITTAARCARADVDADRRTNELVRRISWMPGNAAWWTSVLFAIGSFCFALGAFPLYARLVGASADDVTYFVGSLFFTTAAALQLWQSDHRLAFWASLVQFAGTLFFNRSTFQAMNQNLSASGADRDVWRPDALGSIAFLVSSVISCIDVRRASRDAPRDANWWGAWWNMVGSIAFGVSAVASYVITDSDTLRNAQLANLGTFAGAICFFVAAIIVMPREPAPEGASVPGR